MFNKKQLEQNGRETICTRPFGKSNTILQNVSADLGQIFLHFFIPAQPLPPPPPISLESYRDTKHIQMMFVFVSGFSIAFSCNDRTKKRQKR